MKMYLSEVINCLVKLCQNLLSEGHEQPTEWVQIPIRAMAHAAVSSAEAFIPYLSRTMKLLQYVSSQVPVRYFGVHWAALGMMGDCLSVVGENKFRRYTENTMNQAITAASSRFTILRSMGFIVLALLAEQYPKGTVQRLTKLVPLHLDSILQDEPGQESGQFNESWFSLRSFPDCFLAELDLIVKEKALAIVSFSTVIETTGSLFSPYMGVSCRALLYLSGHYHISVRDEILAAFASILLWEQDHEDMVAPFVFFIDLDAHGRFILATTQR